MTDVPPIVQDVLEQTRAQPLDSDTRESMEDIFGADLNQVRVHTDAQAAAAADAVNARAFTSGQDVVFGAGQYAPETPIGRQLLTHELAHVLQQRSAKGSASAPTIFRQTKGEQMTASAEIWLSTDAQLKAEVDVLRAALREIKADKSVAYNRDEGLKKIERVGTLLALDAPATTRLEEDWKWLVENRKSKNKPGFAAKEKSFFEAIRSPLTTLGASFPKAQTKYWLKNTPSQIVDLIYQAGDAELPANQLFAYAAKEGLIDYVWDEIGLAETAEPTKGQLAGVSTSKPIVGFDYLGLDDFMTELSAKREPLKGILPSSYDLTKISEERRVNEKGREVRSAKFPDLKMALQALAAMLKRRRKLFKQDATANGYSAPTEDELIYWTYIYFNTGEFGGKEQLEKFKGKRRLSDWITKGEYPNAITLLQSHKMLRAMKLFK